MAMAVSAGLGHRNVVGFEAPRRIDHFGPKERNLRKPLRIGGIIDHNHIGRLKGCHGRDIRLPKSRVNVARGGENHLNMTPGNAFGEHVQRIIDHIGGRFGVRGGRGKDEKRRARKDHTQHMATP
jgi:hypothetical protein